MHLKKSLVLGKVWRNTAISGLFLKIGNPVGSNFIRTLNHKVQFPVVSYRKTNFTFHNQGLSALGISYYSAVHPGVNTQFIKKES